MEYIISVLALIISFIALRRTSKAKNLEVKIKYLEELYEVRTKANRLRTGTERQIDMLDEIKHICSFISTKSGQLQSKHKSKNVDIYKELLESEQKMSIVMEEVLENEKSCKEYHEKIKDYENKLEILSSIDKPNDKDYKNLHELKTLVQMRINEQESNFESIRESYTEMLRLYYSCLEEGI